MWIEPPLDPPDDLPRRKSYQDDDYEERELSAYEWEIIQHNYECMIYREPERRIPMPRRAS